MLECCNVGRVEGCGFVDKLFTSFIRRLICKLAGAAELYLWEVIGRHPAPAIQLRTAMTRDNNNDPA